MAREEGSPYKVEDAIGDGRRAVRLVRSRATEWNVNSAKIGFLGLWFSQFKRGREEPVASLGWFGANLS